MKKNSKNAEVAQENNALVIAEDVVSTDLASATGFDYEAQISLLTPEQRKNYLAKADVINMSDMSSIQTFGADVSRTVEENGNAMLDRVRSTNNAEAIQLTNELVAQLGLINIDELSNSGFKAVLRKIPVIRSLVTSTETIMIKYDSIKNNVDKITAKIKQSKIVAKRDNAELQIIFDNNKSYIKQIRELIIAAKLKDEEIAKDIEYMVEHPEQYSTIDVHDAKSFKNALEKRIADLQITEYVFNQNLFQIRAIQSNNMVVANRSDAMVNNVMPIWKNQLALAIIMDNQKNNIEAQKMVTETTNKILRKNAELMKMNSINAAKSNEETIVSLDTLKVTTKELIDTITEVKKIQDDGMKMRATIEQSLADYGKQLTDKITELSSSTEN